MRNYFRLFILVACATLPLSVFGDGSVLVNKVWFDTNAQSSGENGIRVHVDFNAKGVRNHKIKILAFFYDGNKARMEGGVKGYRNTDGHVCISKTLDADYDNSHWKDLKMFIPMRALSLSSGTHTYYIKVRVKDVTQDEYLFKGQYYSFMANGSGNTPKRVESTDRKKTAGTPSVARIYRENGNWGIFTMVTEFKNGYKQRVGYVKCLSCRGSTVCNPCGGTGYCSLCRGKGGNVTPGYGNYIPCTVCNQTGRCRVCNGTGNCFCKKGEYPGYKISTISLFDQNGRVVSSFNSRDYNDSDDSSPSPSPRPRSSERCYKCGGTGIDPDTSAEGGLTSWYGYYNHSENKCPYCKKYGAHSNSRCAHCNVPRQ